MFSEELNGKNPEEIEAVEACETVEEPIPVEQIQEQEAEAPEAEVAKMEEPVATQEESTETEEPAEEPQAEKRPLLEIVKEKWAAFLQKIRGLFPAKDEAVAEEEKEETAAEEVVVEETAEEKPAEETEVEEKAEESLDKETSVEEKEESGETAEEDLFADDEQIAAPAQKKIKPLHLGLAIAAGVVLVCALVFAVLRTTGIDLKPRENDLFYKDNYTVEGEKLEKKADTIVASVGDKELTLSELQLYYINSIYSFYSQNYYYLDYMGLNLEVPLSEQPCTMDTTMTWEQYFLDGTIKSWQSYALVELMAEQDGFTVTEEVQAQIDSMATQLESIAVAYGYADAATYLATEMAPGVTPETYLHFNEVYYVTNEYLADFYEKDYPTDAEILIYHAENRKTFAENGIVPDMGLLSNVRHILIQPMGGTVSEDGMETVYSEDEWNTARSEAERILEAWKSGEATESSFATMANTYSEDPGSNTTGGLYEAIDPFSNYVPEFLNWAVDMNRQPGDTEIVQTSYGYHIMYFVSGQDYFNYVVGEQLVADRIQSKLKVLQEQYPLEVDYKKIMLCEPVF